MQTRPYFLASAVEREHEVCVARNEEKLLRERLTALTQALEDQREAIEDIT
jgi:hypothetical protein